MKFIFTFTFSVAVLFATAQKKKFFFDNAEFSLLLGGDNNHPVSGSDWLLTWPSGRTTPYILDSLLMLIPKDKIFFGPINAGPGIKFTLAKNVGSVTRRGNGLEWKLSAALNKVPYEGPLFENKHYNFFTDTTKTYTITSLSFFERKFYISLQNAMLYKIRSFLLKWVHYYIGVGINISFVTGHTINEQFSQTTYKWNTAARSFQSTATTMTQTDIAGRKKSQLQLMIPWGTVFTLDKKNSIGLEGYYTLSKNNFTTSSYNKKTEGYWLGICYRYAFNK